MNYLIEQLDNIIESSDVTWKKAMDRNMTTINKAIGRKISSKNVVDEDDELSRSDIYLGATQVMVDKAFSAVRKIAKRLKLKEVASGKDFVTFNNYGKKTNPQYMINVSNIKSSKNFQLEIMMTIEGN